MWLVERESGDFCLIVWCGVGVWFFGFVIVVMRREVVGNCGKISVGF